ncbi:ABC transporter permease [Xylocopilactobacillus apis]|uniref:ABC transporter permease n=2 Tax=Xylocopilactobacillus apis TaxID=2932183 RepID=A0AAU9DGC9_9LACO|nr:ABC transporter permease [Xylocopilactobacillus apis]
MKKTYLKASFREIARTKGQFMAIVLIIMLGAMLFVGVKAGGPVLQNSANREVLKQNLSDVQIVSTAGFTNKDLKVLKKVKGASVEAGYQLFYNDPQKNEVFHLLSYNAKAQQNKLSVTAGRLPRTNKEIVLDDQAKKDYHLGDQFKIKSTQINNHQFKIVGFVKSPLFINNEEKGYANVGKGQVDYFAYLSESAFSTPVKSLIQVSFADLKNKSTYSESYKKAVKKDIARLKKTLKNRPQERLNELLRQFDEQLSEAQIKLQKQPPTKDVVQEKEIQSKKKAIVKPVYTYQDRFDNPGFAEYGNLADRIAAIANVFPVFFFFIAALITFTTMTRMVENNRREIGVIKALGYRKSEISFKYLIYTILASIIGVTVGILIGTYILTAIIFVLCSERYSIRHVAFVFDWPSITIAAVVFFLAAVGAAMIALTSELREKPATLMVPKSPKPGKRILLERITIIWSRLSFNHKLTMRNIFRYKSRMIMAVIGISGCTGLLLAGTGLKDSLSSVSAKQFGPITNYQALVILKPNGNVRTVQNELKANPKVKSSFALTTKTVTLHQPDKTNQDLTMQVVPNKDSFKHYIHLLSTKKLNDQGAIITSKIAEDFHLKAGSEIQLTDQGQKLKVHIAGVAENYLGNYIYLSSNYYQKIALKEPKVNSLMVKTDKMSTNLNDRLAQKLLATKEVVSTSFTAQEIKKQNDSISNLNAVVLIFVLLSGLLDFIVLYNLTNINISERMRELSTIKVLGFYDNEVTMYVARENIIFTIFGIVFGWGIGYELTNFILQQAAMENVVFPLVIKPFSYVLAAVLTIVFTLAVTIITHVKLRSIDMVEALKAGE